MGETCTVVRLTTSVWQDKRGLHMKRSLAILRRKSGRHPFLAQDMSDIGAAEVADRIQGLHELDDGVYRVVISNAQRDWETGTVEDYDYRLEPIEGVNHG